MSTTQTLTKKKKSTSVFNPDRTVHWIGSVNNEMNREVSEKVLSLVKKDPFSPIHLIVTSPGGGTGIGLSFYDTMRSVYKPVLHTIGSGDVDSSGIIVFLAGEKRYITPNTTLLLHLAGRNFDSSRRYTTKDMEAMLREDSLKDYQYASVVAERSEGRLTTERVLDMMVKNTVLTAEEALHLGLAHEIVS